MTEPASAYPPAGIQNVSPPGFPNARYRAYSAKDIDRIPQLQGFSEGLRTGMKAVAAVLPFRVNSYVVEELIDWSRVPEDPIYQLTFPQPGMLSPRDFRRMFDLIQQDAPRREVESAAHEIQLSLNPHPAGQKQLNVPFLHGQRVPGLQHKYRETVLYFPTSGQTCHTYCTYCFRWAQFVGIQDLRFATRESGAMIEYLRQHPEVTSVLVTGGDPMVMRASVLRRHLAPLLAAGLEKLNSIRIGTKSLAYWPHRFVTDPDADDLLRLFEAVVESGVHLAVMAHFTHPRELDTPVVEEALRRIGQTGATVRCQAPLVRHVNDSAACWAELWRREVRLGAVPYYMFVARDTGPRDYFEVPLAEALEIFQGAYRGVSGLGRTVRGPSMSATPGKILVEGVADVAGERLFVLTFLQARDPAWVGRTFFARYDREASWIDELRPPRGEREFFFEAPLREIQRRQVAARAS